MKVKVKLILPTSKFPMVVIVKLLDYEDELSLVKAKLQGIII